MKIFSLFLALLFLGVPSTLRAGAVQALRAEFSAVASEDAELVEIATGLQFTEGPVWVEDGAAGKGYLLFSDIPANRIYRWAPGSDSLSVWRSPSGNSNGLLLDSRGRLIACEHGSRRVSLAAGPENAITLCDSYRGARLSSPNDVALGADGSLWFTDPPYGLKGEQPEQSANFVFRLASGASEPEAVVADFHRPNGIVFSINKKVLYISDSGKPHHVRSFRVDGDSLAEIGVFTVISPGGPDGMCVDVTGRLYVTAGDGVHVFTPDGELIGKILTSQTPTNCCFGGEDWRTLFITARPDVYSVRLNVKGLP